MTKHTDRQTRDETDDGPNVRNNLNDITIEINAMEFH